MGYVGYAHVHFTTRNASVGFSMCVPWVVSLFELFDINSSGSLSMQELTAGLSALCSGTATDKARMVFNQYDTDGARHERRSSSAVDVDFVWPTLESTPERVTLTYVVVAMHCRKWSCVHGRDATVLGGGVQGVVRGN